MYFEKIQFNRLGNFSTEPGVEDEAEYRLILSANLVDKDRNSVEINISLVGEFYVTTLNNEYNAERLVSENGVAILFPYLRSEITLLTSQPGFNPVILPAVNIVEMFK